MNKLPGLEAVRGFAALYVFLHHLDPLNGTPLHAVFHYGQEAVMLFFVMSGFVITYASSKPGTQVSWRRYLSNRALRIFPIFVASLVIAAVTATLTHHSECVRALPLLGNLTMLQDAGVLKPGTIVDPFCGNSPLWSLSYEWWFYMLFAVLFFALNRMSWNARRSIALVVSLFGAIAYVRHPNQPSLFAAYFMIWWCGAELAYEYRATGNVSIRGQMFPLLGLTACCAIWLPGAVHQAMSTHHILPGTYPGLPARHFVCALLVVIAATVEFQIPNVLIPLRTALASIGAISFGLYVSHEPIITLVDCFNLSRGVRFVVCTIVVLFVAWMLERVYQPAVVSMLKRKTQKFEERVPAQ